MKTVGIIAEYNPFHNGHAYHIAHAKAISGADYVIVVMSGNYSQRGLPTIVDKYDRCAMALSNGADLVLELPTRFATGSAEYFALGAVSILSKLGVDSVCFGSECGDVRPLRLIADILTNEPAFYAESLSAALKSGVSFPMARKTALTQYFHSPDFLEMASKEEISVSNHILSESILDSPNNILGIEYIKALLRLNSSMEALTICRKGAGYSDTSLSDQTYCSALSIRTHLESGNNTDALSAFIPTDVLSLLMKNKEDNSLIQADDFSSLLYYKLLSFEDRGYTDFADVSIFLSDKIKKHLPSYTSWMQFSELLKSKDITLTRINRSLLHILLDIKNDNYDFTSGSITPYARILGFKENSSALFGLLNKEEISLISKLADAQSNLTDDALSMLKQDIFAAHLYEGIKMQKNGGLIHNEYRRKIVII